ncbi:MAG: hypothetical protein Q7J73_03180 [Dehalococcoidales bacterium]|nr:hypothetical protein [Dehalococcoidales bacterium]
MGKVKRTIFILLGTSLSVYVFSFPARFLENWLMGILQQYIQNNWQLIISFSIIWLLPLAISLGLIYLGYRIRWRKPHLDEGVANGIEVTPITGEKSDYEGHELSAWADLEIKNTGPQSSDMRVKIAEVMLVYEEKDKEGRGIGIYHLAEPTPKWSPANVYWSGITGEPNQLVRTVQPGETQSAPIAFHHKNGSGIGVFNTRTHRSLLESRIAIEISGTGSNTWRGFYYIEYHPPRTDQFEFVEWDLWCKNHKVIE